MFIHILIAMTWISSSAITVKVSTIKPLLNLKGETYWNMLRFCAITHLIGHGKSYIRL